MSEHATFSSVLRKGLLSHYLGHFYKPIKDAEFGVKHIVGNSKLKQPINACFLIFSVKCIFNLI